MDEERLLRLIGEGPYPFPISQMSTVIEVFNWSFMAMICKLKDIPLFPDTHTHSSYEFVILSSPLAIRVDKDVIQHGPNSILPINSYQSHGPAEVCDSYEMIAIMVDCELLQNIADSMFDKTFISFANEFIPFHDDLRILFKWFMDESENPQAGSDFILETLTTQIVVTLLRRAKGNSPSLEHKRIHSARPNIKRTIEFLMDSYQGKYSLQDLANIANLSPYHFIRIFKNETGKTPYEYLMDIKLEKACNLLRKSNLSITEICFLCGFNSPNHFSTVFKRVLGVSPSQYRRL